MKIKKKSYPSLLSGVNVNSIAEPDFFLLSNGWQVTVDGKFVIRLRAEGIVVITLDTADKADSVVKKLKEKLGE